jgi:hypothetical protein
VKRLNDPNLKLPSAQDGVKIDTAVWLAKLSAPRGRGVACTAAGDDGAVGTSSAALRGGAGEWRPVSAASGRQEDEERA